MGSPTVSPPQNRNLTKEMEQVLKGYQETTPGYLALEQQFSPQYQQLQLDLQKQFAPQYAREQFALAKEFAPQYQNLQLGLLQHAVQRNPILGGLSNQARQELALGGRVDPGTLRGIDQDIYAQYASRGNALGGQAAFNAALNRDVYSNQRLQQRQQFAESVQGLEDVWAGLGQQQAGQVGAQGQAATQQSGFGAVSQGLGLFNSMPAYANNLYSQNYAGQLQANVANANFWGGLYGGVIQSVGQVAGAAAMASDERLKKNIRATGEQTHEGIPIKEFDYKSVPDRRFRGVTAQDVQKKVPQAVVHGGGYKGVDYSMIDAPFEEVPSLMGKKVKRYKRGGIVSNQPGPTDTVPALLTPGEGVVNRAGMKRLGRQGLNALNRGGYVQGFQFGGPVSERTLERQPIIAPMMSSPIQGAPAAPLSAGPFALSGLSATSPTESQLSDPGFVSRNLGGGATINTGFNEWRDSYPGSSVGQIGNNEANAAFLARYGDAAVGNPMRDDTPWSPPGPLPGTETGSTDSQDIEISAAGPTRGYPSDPSGAGLAPSSLSDFPSRTGSIYSGPYGGNIPNAPNFAGFGAHSGPSMYPTTYVYDPDLGYIPMAKEIGNAGGGTGVETFGGPGFLPSIGIQGGGGFGTNFESLGFGSGMGGISWPYVRST